MEESLNLKGEEVYSFVQARRAKNKFSSAAVTSNCWCKIWISISYFFDFAMWIHALLIAINSKTDIFDSDIITYMATFILVLKTIESGCNFKGRAASAKIVSNNYKMIASKIEDAFSSLTIIVKDGIADDEIKEWSRMVRLIEELVNSASEWPSPSVTKSIDVNPALNEIKSIENKILNDSIQLKMKKLGDNSGDIIV